MERNLKVPGFHFKLLVRGFQEVFLLLRISFLFLKLLRVVFVV